MCLMQGVVFQGKHSLKKNKKGSRVITSASGPHVSYVGWEHIEGHGFNSSWNWIFSEQCKYIINRTGYESSKWSRAKKHFDSLSNSILKFFKKTVWRSVWGMSHKPFRIKAPPLTGIISLPTPTPPPPSPPRKVYKRQFTLFYFLQVVPLLKN